MIRFTITKDNTTFTTNWEEETLRAGSTATATVRIAQLRATYGPEARISVERNPVPPRAPQEWVRFSVKEKDGAIRFSNSVLKSQADEFEAEIRRDYPKAEISRQEWMV
jgi:hypothetical protein